MCAACHGANGASGGDAIPNLAAFYAQPPATGGAKSALPALPRTKMGFPTGYKASCVKYHTINFSATKQVRRHYANPVAAECLACHKPLDKASCIHHRQAERLAATVGPR